VTRAMLAMLHPCPAAHTGGVRVAPWLLVFAIIYGCNSEASSLLPLLTRLGNSSALEMEPTTMALLTASGCISNWLTLCLAMPALVYLLGSADAPATALRLGALVGGAAVSGFGCAPSGGVLFGLVALQGGTILSLPAIRSMLSRAHEPALQGQVLGSISIMESLAAFVAPLLGGQLWAAMARAQQVPLCFIILGGVVVLTSLASFALRPLPRYASPLQTEGAWASMINED